MADGIQDDEAEYAMVMPFVVCASNGGPFDDRAFVAGYEMGQLDAALAGHRIVLGSLSRQETIRTANAPQADLIALKHGMTMTAEPWPNAPDEWTTAIFTPVQPSDGDR